MSRRIYEPQSPGRQNRCRVYEIPKHIPYLMAPPRMQLYINYAAEIYDIYLDYLSKDDILSTPLTKPFRHYELYPSLWKITEGTGSIPASPNLEPSLSSSNVWHWHQPLSSQDCSGHRR